MKYVRDSHVATCWVQKENGKAALDASFCGIWSRSRSTSWLYPKGSVLAQDQLHRVIPVSQRSLLTVHIKN